MRCKNCSSCHYIPKLYKHQCWGVKEPFFIDNIEMKCSEYNDDYWNDEKPSITNGDDIRNMTDEDLADSIADVVCDSLSSGGIKTDKNEYYNRLIKWLKEEYRDEDDLDKSE